MLYFLNLWLLLLPCCGLLGGYLRLRLGRSAVAEVGSNGGVDERGAIASLWLGLLSWAVVFLALSLYRPLSLGLGVVVLLLGSGLCLLDRRLRSQLSEGFKHLTRRGVLVSALVMVGLAAWMAQAVTWHDTGYYHYSAIAWFRDFGSVPGLALLFRNLGFTSSWFALAAPLNPTFAEARVTAGLNGLALLLAIGHWGWAIRAWGRGAANFGDRLAVVFYTLAIPICLGMKPLSLILVSPSPDLPVFLLVGAVAWAMAQPGRPSLLPVALAAGTVGLKLTALPLLMYASLFYLVRSGWSSLGRRCGALVLVVGMFLLPLMASSVVTSGCPLYPSSLLCLDLPWSPSAQSVKDVAAGTHGWTTWYGTPPAGVPAWLWAVGRWLTTDRSELITGLLILGAVLWVAVQLWRQIQRQRSLVLALENDSNEGAEVPFKLPIELWMAGLGVFGIAFLMVTTPFFRFSVAYIVLLLAVGASNLQFLTPLLTHLCKRRAWTMPSMIALVTLVVLVNLQRQQFGNLVMPPPMRSRAIVQRQINGITYFAPKSGDIPNTQDKDMCWSAPLPCAYEITKDVYLRDPNQGLAGGFVRDRPPQSPPPSQTR